MTDILTPMERTNWMLSACNSTLDRNDVVQVKVGNLNLNFLNWCFSNYYQVQTRPVFIDGHIYAIWQFYHYPSI